MTAVVHHWSSLLRVLLSTQWTMPTLSGDSMPLVAHALAESATLGHIQRGGTPSAFDRVLATRFGMNVIDLVNAEKWGHMVALRGTEIETVDFSAALGALKTVPPERYEAAAMLFG
jgi:6-phosphofructokinase